jgi:dihydrolipoamide dehydrogenase
MTKKHKVDIAIIGSGSAGINAFRAAEKYTDNIMMFEAAHYGTTCARVGCMPSKLLIVAANRAHDAQDMQKFGIESKGIKVCGKSVMSRVKQQRDAFAGGVVESMHKRIDASKLVKQKASFLSDNILKLENGDEVEANAIVIATGSRPFVPDIFHGAGDRLVVNDDIFEWDDLPKSVVVFGTGVVGIELGQALHRLGVRTRILGRSCTLTMLNDPEVLGAARKIFADELDICYDATVHEVQNTGSMVRVKYTDAYGKAWEEEFEYLLAATGRAPNTDNIGLENTSLKIGKDGVPEHDRTTLRCGDTNIFIAGDASGELQLLHEAVDEGRIAGTNAATLPKVAPGDRTAHLGIVFSEPQIAVVGQSYADLKASGRVFTTGSCDFAKQGRAVVLMENHGLLNIYADTKTKKVLGAEMAMPAAEHISHLIAWCIQNDMSVEDMLAMPYYHPVLEEGLRTALRHAQEQFYSS